MARSAAPKLNCSDEAYDLLVKMRAHLHHVMHEVDDLKNEAGSVTGPVPRSWGEYVNQYFENIIPKIAEREAELDMITKAIKDLETACFGK
jgi:hypothetical protein